MLGAVAVITVTMVTLRASVAAPMLGTTTTPEPISATDVSTDLMMTSLNTDLTAYNVTQTATSETTSTPTNINASDTRTAPSVVTVTSERPTMTHGPAFQVTTTTTGGNDSVTTATESNCDSCAYNTIEALGVAVDSNTTTEANVGEASVSTHETSTGYYVDTTITRTPVSSVEHGSTSSSLPSTVLRTGETDWPSQGPTATYALSTSTVTDVNPFNATVFGSTITTVKEMNQVTTAHVDEVSTLMVQLNNGTSLTDVVTELDIVTTTTFAEPINSKTTIPDNGITTTEINESAQNNTVTNDFSPLHISTTTATDEPATAIEPQFTSRSTGSVSINVTTTVPVTLHGQSTVNWQTDLSVPTGLISGQTSETFTETVTSNSGVETTTSVFLVTGTPSPGDASSSTSPDQTDPSLYTSMSSVEHGYSTGKTTTRGSYPIVSSKTTAKPVTSMKTTSSHIQHPTSVTKLVTSMKTTSGHIQHPTSVTKPFTSTETTSGGIKHPTSVTKPVPSPASPGIYVGLSTSGNKNYLSSPKPGNGATVPRLSLCTCFMLSALVAIFKS